ncbi:oligosaccharide flippase family protein [Maribacter sp. ACAM166]|uniref:oligosaccharide flippase family protein n=1 Tax=Maribacter sp. ACAM166 TaxID=2508996 RepID=UPI001484FA7D|nr:oligosaccharide flippase family protein [Maribacter sp. ACAM166]
MSSLAKGSLLIAAGTLYKILLTILIDKYLATHLGVEDFGKFKYGITIVLLLSTLCTLGFNSSIIRSLAIQHSFDKRKILISLSLVLTAIMTFLVVSLGLMAPSLFGVDSPFLYATVFFSLNTLYASIYSGMERPKLKVFINDIFGFSAYLLFIWVYFQFFDQSVHIAQIYLAYVVIVFVFNLLVTKSYYKKIKAIDLKRKLIKEYTSYTMPLFGVSVLIILSANLDKVVLNFFVSEEQLGIYYSVFNISNLLPLILTILVFMYLPRMSRFLQKGKKIKATLLSSYSSKWTMIMASVFFGAIFFYGKEIIGLLYTNDFVSGVKVLQILAFGQWINVSLGFTGQNLLALGDSKRQLYIRLFSFTIGLILLYFGAKYYGNLGASISILAALICSNLLQIVVLKKIHNFVGYRRQNFFTLGIVVLIGLFLSYLHKSTFFENLHFVVSMSIDLVIFVSVLFMVNVIGKKDLKVLKISEG